VVNRLKSGIVAQMVCQLRELGAEITHRYCDDRDGLARLVPTGIIFLVSATAAMLMMYNTSFHTLPLQARQWNTRYVASLPLYSLRRLNNSMAVKQRQMRR
jgi:hypothetical protein